ncbi:MAG: prepilin-type N-terminal cleavage/methylation domain-containing protein [Capsulimonadales bacterium]|nr:prepilin-type N-terminal cleavage/methylation domain-containing protein [Capsulimonadales bacterium]
MKSEFAAVDTTARNRALLRKRRTLRGITLIEVLISLFIFAMMGLMFSAVIPTALRSAKSTGSYGHAMTIATRKVDQLLEAGFNRLDTTNLRTLGIVDNTTPTTSTGANGTITTYTFTDNDTASNSNNPDNLRQYFPSGATGTIRIEPWAPGMYTLNGTTQPMLMQATVTITWREATGPIQNYSVSTLITRMAVP